MDWGYVLALNVSALSGQLNVYGRFIVSTSGAGNVLSECGTLPSPPDRRLGRRQLCTLVATLDDTSATAKFGFDPLACLLRHITL